MKQMIKLLLSVAILLSGCSSNKNNNNVEEWVEIIPEYNTLSDENLTSYVEDLVYRDTINALNSTEYVVENVRAVYVSKEYINELEYNSQSNIYFGYTLRELDEIFQGNRYVFTLGQDGKTTVKELQVINDDITNEMIKNVAIGSGVILVCVTVSVVSAGAGAPAVSMIFAASAKTGTAMALSSGGFGGLTVGIVRGIQTGDFEEAMEAAALASSEGFKWGAISGASVGGAKEAFFLKSATKGGLTLNQAAIIQKETNYPLEIIQRFNSMKQYNIVKNAGLSSKIVNGKAALVRNIDLNYVDEVTGKTNLQLMLDGNAPIAPDGYPYELHHLGQKSDSPLAILTKGEHTQNGNHSIWHILTDGFDNPANQPNWGTIKKSFWKEYARMVTGGE